MKKIYRMQKMVEYMWPTCNDSELISLSNEEIGEPEYMPSMPSMSELLDYQMYVNENYALEVEYFAVEEWTLNEDGELDEMINRVIHAPSKEEMEDYYLDNML